MTGKCKYTKNEEFFSKPNIENNYWAGLLAADGCISLKRNCIQLAITEKDRILVDNLCSAILYTGVIYNSAARFFEYNNGKMSEIKPQVRLFLHSATYKKDLQTWWNIGPKKSLTHQPPNITDFNQKLAFISGYFDGDGSLCFDHHNKAWNIKIIGTREFLNWIKEQIQPLIYSKVGVYKNGKVAYLRVSTTKGTQQFLDLINNVYASPLQRKHIIPA